MRVLMVFLFLHAEAFVVVQNTGEVTLLGPIDIDPLGQDEQNKSAGAGIRFKFNGVRAWNIHMQDWGMPLNEQSFLISKEVIDGEKYCLFYSFSSTRRLS